MQNTLLYFLSGLPGMDFIRQSVGVIEATAFNHHLRNVTACAVIIKVVVISMNNV